eukprot:GEMP01030041.1.p1 GENE.GEMP01030041.1~~GEMP01030041.1.p1  ORF type:complete len:710 (+),score=150.49 GEMP01030041.1:44-2131(+)
MATVVVDGGKRKLEVDGDTMEIIPLGAGSEVGRSCCIVKFKGKTVMFDCGVHPAHSGMSTLPYFDHIKPAEVDLCLITHFHLDHSGAVPYLANRTEFAGRIFMTHPTKPICKLLWQDYSRVSKISSEDQIFTQKDIDNCMKKIELIDFHEKVCHNGIQLTCFGAGHVLGAAMMMVEINGVRVLYTGDYSREIDRHLPQAEIPPVQIHVLIVESTYGIQNHEPREQREHRFTNAVHHVVRQGGKCLIPVFALGRAQEILLILEDYWNRSPELQNIPIYYNSPMANKCARIYETYTNMCSIKVQEETNKARNPWHFKYVKNMPERDRAWEESQTFGACVVLAAPGMLQSGVSRELFELWAPDKRNGIVVTGYAVQGTLANELKNDPDTVTLHDGRKLSVKAMLRFISFSAHADYQQTAGFIQSIKTQNVVLVHGEETEMSRMKTKLLEEHMEEPNFKVFAPQNCQPVHLEFDFDPSVEVVGDLALDASRKRTQPFQAVLLEDTFGARTLLQPNELQEFTRLKACSFEQTQRLVFPHGLQVLHRALADVFDDAVFADETVTCCGLVAARLSEGRKSAGRILEISWRASPVADMVADSVAMVAIELTANPSAVQALQCKEEADQQEQKLFSLWKAYLKNSFAVELLTTSTSESMSFEVEGVQVHVNLKTRSVVCADEALRKRVLAGLLRCNETVTPVKV